MHEYGTDQGREAFVNYISQYDNFEVDFNLVEKLKSPSNTDDKNKQTELEISKLHKHLETLRTLFANAEITFDEYRSMTDTLNNKNSFITKSDNLHRRRGRKYFDGRGC